MRNSFILYTEYEEQIEMLNDEQAATFLRAVFAYASGKDLPEMDGMTAMLFSMVKRRMDRDQEKYEEVAEKRAEAGRKGGRPRSEEKANAFDEKQTKAKKSNGFFEKQKNPVPVPVPVPVLDTVPDKEKEKESKEREKPEKSPAVVIAKLDAPDGVKQRLQGFVDMRRTMKKPMTGRAVELLWKELSKLSSDPATQEKILDQSIMNSWQSVYPLKSEPRARSGTSQLDQFLRIARGEDDISGNGENHINDQGLFSSVL